MHRATSVCPSGAVDNLNCIDRVVLDADERQRRRIVLVGENGTRFLLDLAHAMALHDGDGLVLASGGVIRVVARPEALIEVTAADPAALARIAWHLGNRHVQVEIVGERVRFRRDHVLEDMLRGLGARLTQIEAPFEPEHGAYGHRHDHGDRDEFHV